MSERSAIYKSYNSSIHLPNLKHTNGLNKPQNETPSSGCLCFCNETGETGKRKSRNKVIKGCISSFTVCAGLVGYTFLGAIIFAVIEGDGFLSRKNSSSPLATNFGSDIRERAVENIWEITVNLNILYRENWTKLASQEISKFQEQLLEKLTNEINTNKEINTDVTWDLSRSLLYSITILTTTGYGKMGPKTMLGKMVTMIYAAIGIPLMLVYLSNIGNLLSNCTLNIYSRSFCCSCRRCCCTKKVKQQPRERLNLEPFYSRSPSRSIKQDCSSHSLQCPENLHKSSTITINHFSRSNSIQYEPTVTYMSTCLSIILCLAVMIAYVCCGASILCVLERNWSYLDGIFFCFMTLSTINFVDTVPSKLQTYSDTTVWFFSLYILSGMALTAMCFNIFHKEVVYQLENYSTLPKNLDMKPIPQS